MYTDLTHLEVLSRRPLWYYYDNQPVCVENNYSNEEVVRIYKADGNSYDIPIKGDSVIITEIGATLYKTQEDAIRFRDVDNDLNSLSILIKNQFNSSMRNPDVKTISGYPIDFSNGLYSVSNFDDYLYSNSTLLELRYLDSQDIVRKIHQVESNNLINYINDYMTVHNIDKYDIANERIVFEIYIENRKVYIDTFSISYCSNMSGPIMWSPINNYPLFTSKFEAQAYRYELRNKNENTRAAITILRKQYEKQHMVNKQIVDAKIVDAVGAACDFVMGDLKVGDKATNYINKQCDRLKHGGFKKRNRTKFPEPKLRDMNKDIRTCDEDDIFIEF